MVTVLSAKNIQIPSPMFNWVCIKNILPFPVDIQAMHDEIGNPIIEIHEVSTEDEELKKQLRELEGKEV